MFFNTNKLVVRVDGWLGGWMMIKSAPFKIQAICADSKYGVKKVSTVVKSKVKSKLNSKSLNFKSDFPGGRQLNPPRGAN